MNRGEEADRPIEEWGTPRPAAEQAAPGLKTRRDCTLLGAKVFACCTGACVLTAWLPLAASVILQQASLVDDCLAWLLLGLFIAVPPAWTIGAAIGFEAYRLAAGSRKPRDISLLVWVLLFLCVLGWATIFVFLQYRRRKKLIVEKAAIGWVGPVLYGLMLACITVLVAAMAFLTPNAGAKEAATLFWLLMVINSSLSLLIGDCIVVNMVARLHQEGRLAPPYTHNIQYSLATLFYGTLGFGAYCTGLVMIFGK